MEKKNKRIGSYPNTMIVVSLTAALFLIGFCGLLVVQSKKLVTIIRQNMEVSVFLDKALTKDDERAIRKEILNRPFISRESDSTVIYVSKEEAAEKFVEGTKEDFASLLGENPMLNSYRVKVSQEYFSDARLQSIKKELEAIKGVHEVVYQENLADQINKNITKIYVVLAVFALAMIIIIVLLINNTIRLAIYSQRFLIRSMQLVGATDAFIHRPFLMHGALQGLASGLIAGTALLIFQQTASRNIEGLPLLQEYDKIFLLLLCIIALGVGVAVICTFQSLARYLRIRLDDLY